MGVEVNVGKNFDDLIEAVRGIPPDKPLLKTGDIETPAQAAYAVSRFIDQLESKQGVAKQRAFDLPDLSRTQTMLAVYDEFGTAYSAAKMSGEEAVAGLKKLEELGEAVGMAFGMDTADRNSVETCKRSIRPGPKVPGPGCELSFVRRMVALWEQRKAEGRS